MRVSPLHPSLSRSRSLSLYLCISPSVYVCLYVLMCAPDARALKRSLELNLMKGEIVI